MKSFILTFVCIFCFCFMGNAQENNSSPHQKTIKGIIPLQVGYPSNNEIINNTTPVFVWTPPTAGNNLMVTYSILVVQLQAGQTSAEALLQNSPLLITTNITNTFFKYPSDAAALRDGNHYAWQVAASSAGQSLGAMEPSSFTVKKVENKSENINYPVASKVSKERFYVCHGVFYFSYDNMAHEKTLTYTIKSMDKSMENIKSLPALTLGPGMNRLKVDLSQSGQLKSNTYYYLEITDKKKQVYKLMYFYVES
jgi:hypothetical protein